MIRRIINLLKKCGPIGYLLAGILYGCALTANMSIIVTLGLLSGYYLTGWTDNGELICVAMTVCTFLGFCIQANISLDGPLGFLSIDALTKDPKEARAKKFQIEGGVPEKYDELPHFGKFLKKKQVMKIIEKSHFSQYRLKTGEQLRNVTVSEDDKWVCILGGYMPIDLICGYNREKNVLYTIDGGVVGLPFRAKSRKIRDDIEAFFKDRGDYFTSKPRKANEKFISAFERPVDVLDKADFSRLRYMWEKSNASDKSMNRKRRNKGHKYQPVLKLSEINTEFFSRVLSDTEIKATADAIRKKKIKLMPFMDPTKYVNEFCVCNAVELLGTLKYPANGEGMNFLFRCIRDVDEAYFGPAIDALLGYPKGPLQKKIEEEVKRAFENNDVVGLAGVMFLAKEIDYEIRYIKEMKQAGEAGAEGAPATPGENAEAQNGATANAANTADAVAATTAATDAAQESAANAIPEFDFDELKAFGSEEVQGFEVGGMAYQKKE